MFIIGAVNVNIDVNVNEVTCEYVYGGNITVDGSLHDEIQDSQHENLNILEKVTCRCKRNETKRTFLSFNCKVSHGYGCAVE